jgi:hypothetical protein
MPSPPPIRKLSKLSDVSGTVSAGKVPTGQDDGTFLLEVPAVPSQSPWLTDIDGGGHALGNVSTLGVNGSGTIDSVKISGSGNAVALGASSSFNQYDVAVGAFANANYVSVALGYDSSAASGIAIGFLASASGGIAIGQQASAPYSNSTAIGFQVVATAANQCNFGVANLVTAGSLTPGTVSVSALPAGSAGQVLYASNGRNPGEGGGAGTGTVVYYNGTFGWCVIGTNTPVTA